MDVSSFSWHLPDVKETHELDILSMKITEYFARRSNVFDDHWLSGQDLSTFLSQFDDMLTLTWELSVRLDFLTIFRFKQWLQEHLAKGIIRILVDLCAQLFLVRIQFLWFLSKLIN